MSDARLVAGRCFIAATAVAAPQEAGALLLPLLHADVVYRTLGKSVAGAPAVVAELLNGPNGELARRLDWHAPQMAGDAVRLTGERKPGTRDRGLIATLHFEGGLIGRVEHQRTPPPAPDATSLKLPVALKRMVDQALVERHPMLMAYCDAEGQPVLSFRGSVQVTADDQLGMWIRSANGAFIRAIAASPRVALVYRNEDSKATYNFQGRARVSHLPADRQRVFDASAEAERAHDFAMLGVVVLVDLDRVEGYSGLGPGGQVDQIRLLRSTAAH